MALRNILFSLGLFLVLSVRNAPAAQRGLFLLGDLRQWVNLSYLYYDQSQTSTGGRSASSGDNRFEESYRAQIAYAVVDPRILKGKLAAQIKFNQENSTGQSGGSGSSGFGFYYDISGVFLERKPYPVNFLARSELTHAEMPFGGGYDVNSDIYSVGFGLQHKFVPFHVDYTKSISETSGLTNDRKQTGDIARLYVTNSYSISETELVTSYSKIRSESKSSTGGPPVEDSLIELQVKNRLTSRDNGKSLSSFLSYRTEQISGLNKNLSLSESFSWQLGKALSLGADYGTGFSSFTDASGVSTDVNSQSAGISLSHRLFQSISTRLAAQARQDQLTNGKENDYSGSFLLTYTKLLPADSNMMLGYQASYVLTDRNLTSGNLTAFNEPLIAHIAIGDKNLLKHPNVVLPGIVIRDADNPVTQYTEGSDYLIIQVGSFTGFDFSVPGSLITEGKRLIITYVYQVNPDIKYSTLTQGGNGALSLFNGKYQIAAAVTHTGQTLIVGEAENLRLSNSTQASCQIIRNYNGIYTSVSYVNNESDLDRYQTVEALYRSSHYIRNNSLNVQVRDRYTAYGATAARQSKYSENQISVNGGLSRNLSRYGTIQISGAYTHSTSPNAEKDEAVGELIYRWKRGKLAVEAAGKTHWRFSAFEKLREDQVNVGLSRYF